MNTKPSQAAYTRQVIDLATALEETPLNGVDTDQSVVSFSLFSVAAGNQLQFIFGSGGKPIPADELVGKTVDFTNHGSQPPHTSGILFRNQLALAPGSQAIVVVTFNRRCEAAV